MKVNNVYARALSAMLVTILLNGSVVAAFAHVAAVRGAQLSSEARAWA